MSKTALVYFRDGSKVVKKGDTVYVTHVNHLNATREIEKVGNALIHLDDGTKFYFDGRNNDKDFSYHYSLWSSKEAYDEAVKHSREFVEVQRFFRCSTSSNISKEMLSEVRKTIGLA